MNLTKLLFFVVFFVFSNLTYSQYTPKPSLNFQNPSTLIIDSIPVTKLKSYRLQGITNTNNNYTLFFNLPYDSQFPSFSISRFNPYRITKTDAFNHRSLFDPQAYVSLQRRSWDNPMGVDSYGIAVFTGIANSISDIFRKN